MNGADEKTVISVDILDALGDITDQLRGSNVSFALSGPVALMARCGPRDVRALEVVVAIETDEAFEGVVDELAESGWDATALVEHPSQGRLATARLVSGSGVQVDLVAARCGIEGEVVERAEPMLLEGAGEVEVVRAEDLLAMKLVAMVDDNLEDRRDALMLLSEVDDLDHDAVRSTLRLVSERGYDRGRDLETQLERLIGRTSTPPSD